MAVNKFKGLALVHALFLIGLSACNGPDQPLTNVDVIDGGNDTHNTDPTPEPTPTATPTPTPTPTSSPSPNPNTSDLYTGPAEVAKYVQKFVDDAKIQGIDVTPEMSNPKLEIQIESLNTYGSSVIGLCETSGNTRRVTFDPDFWNSVSETQKELLAHHELGHCVLYRPHRSDLLSGGAYSSIMYPIIMSSSTYTNNYDYYQNELFTWSALAAAVPGNATETTHICDFNEL